jgi:uncharacterized protein (TIGR02246 family)
VKRAPRWPLIVIFLPSLPLCAQAAKSAAAVGDETAIRAAVQAQADAWNRADLRGFMQAYEDSDDTTFIGLSVRKGYGPILKRYQENYTTPEEMGRLSFHDLDVRLLPTSCGKAEIALVTGRFHLDRATHGEANKDDGVLSLVWRKGSNGWKIVLDHTS